MRVASPHGRSKVGVSRIAIVLIIVVIMVLAGGASYYFVAQQSSYSTTQRTSQPKRPIEIGVDIELTGVTAPSGQLTFIGIQLATSEINATGGINGAPIHLVVLDAQSNPNQVLANARILDKQNNVLAIMAGANSNDDLALKGYAESNAVPVIVPTSEATQITGPGTKWTVRYPPDAVEWGAALAKFATDNIPGASIAIAASDFSLVKDIAIGAQWYVQRTSKGNIVYNQIFPLSQSDFTSAIAAIKATNPDFVFNLIFGPSIGTFQREAVQAGINANRIVFWADASLNIYPMANFAVGSYAATFFTTSFSQNSSTIANFVSTATSFLKSHPVAGQYQIDYTAYFGYSAMKIVAQALKDVSGTLDRQSFMSALLAVRYNNILGKQITFDQYGATPAGYYIVQITSANSTNWYSKPITYVEFPSGYVPVYDISVK